MKSQVTGRIHNFTAEAPTGESHDILAQLSIVTKQAGRCLCTFP